MATLLIENLIDAKLTITDTALYDVVIFGEAEGIKAGGQVISVFGSSDFGGFDADLESYSLALGKSDATLTVGGNYNNSDDVSRGSYNYYGGEWHFYDYSSSYIQADRLEGNYNIYHTQFNDDYDSGAVKFSGSNARLVITAQNGAGYANFYNKANGTLKTDDAVKLRSDSYGIFSAKTMYNGAAWYGGSGEPSAPAKLTTAYTINAVNTLTVGSDLAGQIETNVAALHAGYRLPNDSNGKTVWGDDSSGNSIIGAGVKAKDLVLESNFRANITTKNNADVFDDALWYSSSEYERGFSYDAEFDSRRKLEERVIVDAGTAAAEAGSTEGTTTEEPDVFNDGGKDYFNGTTVAALKTATASNNDIISYGIYTTSSLKTGAQSIWAGKISVETSDVNIIADEKYLKPTADGKTPDTTVANASNNSIRAYGIKVDGELNISSMGGLKKDETKENQNVTTEYASINVTAEDNYIIASAKGTKDKAASASVANSTLTAAGIYAETLKLGAVDSNVEINVTAKNNKIEAFASDGKASPSANISGTKIDVYGIYASNATFADFYGNITVKGDNNGVQYTGTKTGSSSYTTAGIYVTSSLTSTTNLYGTITVNDDGVYGIRGGSITVDGVIDTTINSNSASVGIYAANSLKADAFTGNINVGDRGVGITVIAGALTGTVSGDSFDIAGEITGAYAVSANSLNVRVSGTIDSEDGTAIQSEVAWNYNSGTVTATKANDNVELAYGSEVYGNIELGALQNTLTVSSGATYSGIISAAEGYLNMTFNLDEYIEHHTAVTVTDFDENDSVLGQSSTITVNLNYAEIGKEYNLIHYDFDASKYWAGDQIAFRYQGHTAQTTLAADVNGGYSGDFEIKIGENNSVTGTATFKNNTFSVKVNSKDEGILKDFSTANIVKEEYDAKKDEFILSWDNSKISASDYNLTSVAAYEIEYYLYDKAWSVWTVKLTNMQSTVSIIIRILNGVCVFWVTPPQTLFQNGVTGTRIIKV